MKMEVKSWTWKEVGMVAIIVFGLPLSLMKAINRGDMMGAASAGFLWAALLFSTLTARNYRLKYQHLLNRY